MEGRIRANVHLDGHGDLDITALGHSQSWTSGRIQNLDGRQFFAVDEGQVDAATWTAAVDHGYSIIFDLAIGGSYPNGVCGCTTPTDQTTSGATMTVRDVAVYVARGRRSGR